MYSILKSGVALSDILTKTGKYTFHNFRTRDMLSLLINAQQPPFDANFTSMSPIYNISFDEIKNFFTEKAKDIIKKQT
jgi:hypothetical protein